VAQAGLGYKGGFPNRSSSSQMMKVIQGGFDERMWLHDRNAYSDKEIEVWNARLEQQEIFALFAKLIALSSTE
jgi:hypothetical protein